MAEIFKFPYDASRRVHSRKPRRSKNGTPEERAAKATTPTNAAVIKLGKIPEHRPAQEDKHSLSNFLRSFRQYFEQEFRRGRNVDQIFDGLEETYLRADRALSNRGQQSETSDF
jgi:hypothetical protein